MAVALACVAQDPPASPVANDGSSPTAPLGVAAVHGVVKNAVTGEPLPRALVLVGGEGGAATLTDGDGRFEIPGVAMGTNVFELTKPGFEDSFANGFPEDLVVAALGGITHNVLVTAETPELVFTMRPTNVIRGQIQLSTGDPAQNITVVLLGKTILDGRAVWRPRTNKRTDSDGAYRFSGLPDGVYVIETQPAMASEAASFTVAGNSDSRVAWSGYPGVFYPEAREFSSAAKIKVAGGEQAQANILLNEAPFHVVRATVAQSGGAAAGTARPVGQNGLSFEVRNTQGEQLPYDLQFDAATHTLQAILPDGSYELRATQIQFARGRGSQAIQAPAALAGQTDVTVAGHAIRNLRIALSPESTNPLQMVVTHGATAAASGSSPGNIFIAVSQAGGADSDGLNTQFAESPAPGTVETTWQQPGSYWVHTIIAQPGLCEASFTAGGASLAREPLVVGAGGTTAPLTLTLRDDCAMLKLSLPPSEAGMRAGEEQAYTVFVVPDFDFTTEVHALTLRPSAGVPLVVDNLTPGSYRVYTIAGPAELEYRNAEALAGLAGQAVTLAPGATENLVLDTGNRK